MSRRRFLGAGAAAGASLDAVIGPYAVANGQPVASANGATAVKAQTTSSPQGFEFFNTFQADIINAAAGRIIPADDNGPGAIEAGVVYFTTTPAPGGSELSTRHPSDANLTMGAKAFFDLLRSHVVAGFFADPVHGGNRGMIGWKLIGYPGAQVGYRRLITNYGQPFTGEYKSLADYQGQFSVQPTTPPQG